MKYDLDIIIPVFREEGNISKTIEEIFKIPEINFRVMVVYDFDEDPTIQVIKNNFDKSQIKLIKLYNYKHKNKISKRGCQIF